MSYPCKTCSALQFTEKSQSKASSARTEVVTGSHPDEGKRRPVFLTTVNSHRELAYLQRLKMEILQVVSCMTQYCWVCKQSADLYRAQRVIHQLQLQVYTVMVQPLHCLPPDYRISAIHTERKPHPQVKNEVGLISPPAALELLHTSREGTYTTSGRACHLRLIWTRKAAILYNSVSDISLLK